MRNAMTPRLEVPLVRREHRRDMEGSTLVELGEP